ncbi:MAG: carbamate kinase [Thermotogae bacterium]|nr:carbamate kinase [Thermotogota bacterium]
MRVVVALGGNALRKKGEGFDYETHYDNALLTFQRLAEAGFFSNDRKVVITHGNGPQVGMEFVRHFLTKERFPMYPLHALTASTQGWIGYILEATLRRTLRERGMEREVATLMTMVEVSPDDPALRDPSKPIGEFMTKEQAMELSILTGLPVKEDANRGWRLVVGSPKPLRVINSRIVKALMEAGVIVIAAGGGGVPVKGDFSGVPAVIDKDRASALLGLEVGADALYILTQVPAVYINYGKPDQRPLRKVRVEELKRYAEEGHFAPGSMLPKVEAAISFVEGGGKRVVITSPDFVAEAERGEAGTVVLP